jgi:hypothetical protein
VNAESAPDKNWNPPMEMLRAAADPPTGLAFEISDLLLLQGWANLHDIRMVVELDHWVEGEEYEEVVALYARDSSLRRGILWRSAKEIVVQPLIGRSCRFGSVAGALDSMFKTWPDCQQRSPPPPRSAAKPRRLATPRRAQCAGKADDSGASAANASSSVPKKRTRCKAQVRV